MASPIKLAVLRTVAYASIFNYHSSLEELYQYLISPKPVSKTKLKPYFIPKPQSVNHFNQLKWRMAHRAAKILSLIPWVNLVAVTGALAMNNAAKNDDIDLMIITSPNRLWLTRLLATVLLFPHLRGGRTDSSEVSNKFCLNLWLDETALKITQQNLYTAHEICQLKSLFDRHNTYQKFIHANLWYKNYLANWTMEEGRTLTGGLAEGQAGTAKPEGPTLMGWCVLNGINFLAFRLQFTYMKPKMTREQVGRHSAFFHPRPTGKIVLQKYQQLLQGPTLMDSTVLVTGCFDVLHQEHKKLLLAAKNLGGKLLVGVETDARVRKLKGPSRPINLLRVRLKNLRQLGIADQVFSLPKKFNDLNHFTALINQIKPDILAVSASTPHLAVKRRIMKRFGGRVVIVLPHNPKLSTTTLTNKKNNSII